MPFNDEKGKWTPFQENKKAARYYYDSIITQRKIKSLKFHSNTCAWNGMR